MPFVGIGGFRQFELVALVYCVEQPTPAAGDGRSDNLPQLMRGVGIAEVMADLYTDEWCGAEGT